MGESRDEISRSLQQGVDRLKQEIERRLKQREEYLERLGRALAEREEQLTALMMGTPCEFKDSDDGANGADVGYKERVAMVRKAFEARDPKLALSFFVPGRRYGQWQHCGIEQQRSKEYE